MGGTSSYKGGTPPRAAERGAGGYNDPGAHGLWGAHGLQEGP